VLSAAPKRTSPAGAPTAERLFQAMQQASAAPLSTVNVWCTVQGYADQIGLSHIKPHDFRRFVGTQLAKRDIRKAQKAQKALGHKHIDTTAQHYVLDEPEEGLTDDLYE
jgi:integrase